jgi:GDP-mannose transporter
MAGALNKLPVAVSGMIFFNAPVTFFSVTAVLIGNLSYGLDSHPGFGAGVVYAMAKSIQARQAKMVLPTTNPMSASSQSHRDAEKV